MTTVLGSLTLVPVREEPGYYVRLVRYERHGDRAEAVRITRDADGSGITVLRDWRRLARSREWPKLPPPAESEDLRRARLVAAWVAAGSPELTTCTPDHSIRAFVVESDPVPDPRCP